MYKPLVSPLIVPLIKSNLSQLADLTLVEYVSSFSSYKVNYC